MSSTLMILLVVVVAINVHAESVFQARNTADDHDEKLVSSGGFKVDLIHPDSPSLHKNTAFTRLERLRRGIRRSKSRATYLAARHYSGHQLPPSKDGQSPLFSADDEYNMEFELGTPPVKFQAIMDTGSDLVWVQCNPCKHCYKQQGPVFSPKNSSSYRSVPCSNAFCGDLDGSCKSGKCSYEYGYGDGSSTTGELALDAISMQASSGSGSTHKVGNIVFGCGHEQSGDFGKVGGLVGLGQGPASLVSQLSPQFQKKFSYYMVNFEDAPTKTGLMQFGASAGLKGAGIKTTPIVSNRTLYYINVEGISVAGEQVAILNGSVRERMENRTIIDSGTTLTLLHHQVYSSLKSLLMKHISLETLDASKLTDIGFDLCYNRAAHMDYKFPSLTFHFTNADIELPSGNYFVGVNKQGTHVCFAMLSSSQSISIIGNLQQQNFNVLYDVGGAQLSFQPTTC